jgi:glyoxylase-like metal-dependent hydrolase (beta-lactamase superfamily II)
MPSTKDLLEDTRAKFLLVGFLNAVAGFVIFTVLYMVLNDQISYEFTGGHCENHQVFLINEDNETVFFGADILPEPEQLLRKFIAKYDFDGRRSMELRQEYGLRAVEGNWECLFYHAKSKAIAKVGFENDGFRIV